MPGQHAVCQRNHSLQQDCIGRQVVVSQTHCLHQKNSQSGAEQGLEHAQAVMQYGQQCDSGCTAGCESGCKVGCEGGCKVGCEIAGAGGASLDDMIMNSIGVPGASAGADSLLPQSGVKLHASPTPSLPIFFLQTHWCSQCEASSLRQICVSL